MKAVLSLSGGIDSTTLAVHLIRMGIDVIPVSFNYGSKHNERELEAGGEICSYLDIPQPEVIDVTDVSFHLSSNLLGDGPIPEGHYTEENMKKTVVPCRNLIFASILAGIADSNGAKSVGLGVHEEDHYIYPDCRGDFIRALRDATLYATEGRVMVLTPLLDWSKKRIVEYGLSLGAPYHLTRTCYKTQNLACGRCGACRERLEAFESNNVDDPIKYER